jgi:solute carrier family 30 (zinc transporter), member 5/7
VAEYFQSLAEYFTSIGEKSIVFDIIRVSWADEQSRKILTFFTVNLTFFFVEITVGYISNSLGLISDAFHMLFDCTALLIGLVASYISQVKKSDNEYTFGYIKIETLSGLFNGMFLVFIAFDILFESVGRIFEP